MRNARFVKLPLALLLAGSLLSSCQSSGKGVTVSIDPSEVRLAPGSDQAFSAVVTGTADTAVSWSVTGGTIEGAGGTVTYHAPAAAGEYEVRATSDADPTKQAAAGVTVVPPGGTLWSRAFGTDSADLPMAVAVDSDGNVLVAGHTNGALAGDNAGEADVFVQKRAASGDVVWTRQLGTSALEGAFGVAVDAAGNVVVTGVTQGALVGGNAGGFDAFVRKYDQNGNVVWTRQFGTVGDDEAQAVAVDAAGNILVSGYTDGALVEPGAGHDDAFVRMYDQNGDIVWTRQLGDSDRNEAHGVAVDAAGNVLVAGYTTPTDADPSAEDVLLWKLDASGNTLWTAGFDTGASDQALAAAVDASRNVLIVGITRGALDGGNAGGADAFVRKYGPSADVVWTRQLGTNSDDYALAVAVDAEGNPLVAGYTFGSLAGDDHGAVSAFVRKYDQGGAVVWTRQLGDGAVDGATGVAADASGNVLLVGLTNAPAEGGSDDSDNGFVAKLAP